MSKLRASVVAIVGMALAGISCSASLTVSARQAFERGTRRVHERKFQEAIIEFRRAVRADPHYGEAHYALANAFVEIDDARDAFNEYLTAADLLPDNIDAQLKAGSALLLVGRAKEAAARAERVLRKDPNSFDARILRANATAGQRNLDDAISQMHEVVDQVPDRPADQARAYLHLGVMELARGHRQDAEGILRKATAVEPASAINHLTLANYYWAIGRYADAETELTRVLELAPTEARANRALASLYVITGRMAEAEKPLIVLASSSPEPATRFLLADYYMVAGRTKDATVLLNTLAADRACFAQARLRLALIEHEAGRIRQAEQIIDDTLHIEPTHPRVLMMKARLLVDAKSYNDALSRVSAAIAAEPKLPEAHYLMGTIRMARNEPMEAIDAFNRVLKLRPTFVDALLQLAALHLARADAETAVRFAEQAVTIAPQHATAHLVLARGLLARGNAVGAGMELQPLLEANPRSAPVLTEMGRLSTLKQDSTAARRFYTSAMEADPNDLDPLTELATLDISTGHAAEVRRVVEERLAMKPNDPTLMFLAARVYAAVGDRPKTEDALLRAVELDPSNLRAYGALGQMYYAEGRLDAARREFEQIAARQPTSVGAFTMLAMIQELAQRPADARKAYEHALQLDPRAAVAANNLACLYVRTGDNLNVALQLAQAAQSEFPNEPEFNDTLGWIYVKKDLPGSALRALLDSVRLNPKNASFHYHLGVAYLKKGQQTQARYHFLQALDLHQDFDGVAEARALFAQLPPPNPNDKDGGR